MNQYSIIAHVQFSLFRKCLASGWKIDTRALVDHELVLITGGKGKIVMENTTYILKQGTLLYLYPGLLHSLSSNNDNPLSFYGVHFSYQNVRYTNNQWFNEDNNGILPIKIISEVLTYPKVETLFKKLNQHWNEKSLGFEMICRSAFLEILYNLLHTSETNYSSRQKIDSLLTYIRKNLYKKITVEELALQVNLSPDYLASQFKNITGFTIVQYINQCRIDHAKILLLNRELKIKEIALHVGFCDEFYFSKIFKKYEGISPKVFIKNMS